MAVNSDRPINLDLTTISFPVPAIVSILHRISGVVIFFALPLMLWLCQESLISEDAFLHIKMVASSPLLKFCIWGVLSATIYHLIAGIRHLLMDMGYGEELAVARSSAWAVLGVSLVAILVLGVWIW